MTTLKDRLAETDRQTIIADTVNLIDNEVRSKKGLSGMALKTGYKVVKKLKNGRMIERAVDNLLDDFTEALDPLYQEYLEQDSVSSFETYLAKHDDRATDALLSITDNRAKNADGVAKATYDKLRGQADKHVRAALPGVGDLIDRRAPRD